ncbi:MAG: hypothetical protein ABIE74_08850 [Pseudomonadota bacterium]
MSLTRCVDIADDEGLLDRLPNRSRIELLILPTGELLGGAGSNQ